MWDACVLAFLVGVWVFCFVFGLMRLAWFLVSGLGVLSWGFSVWILVSGWLAACLWLLVGWALLVFIGEFDPGSGRTLAACLTHASRTMKTGACTGWISGERVSNT